MIRTIDGFRQDEAGEWVARLSCLHTQHVHHRPPFRDRPWVLTDAGRAERVGTPIDCSLCDRAELPDGLEAVRTAGPFDQTTLPAALQQHHRVGDRTWAVLHVVDGSVDFEMATEPPTFKRLDVGDRQPIPPAVEHRVVLVGPTLLQLEFLVDPRYR